MGLKWGYLGSEKGNGVGMGAIGVRGGEWGWNGGIWGIWGLMVAPGQAAHREGRAVGVPG